MSTRADRLLRELVSRTFASETDLYPYMKEFFTHILGYPRDRVVLGVQAGTGTPDLSLLSKDGVYWSVGEVKNEPGRFRDPAYRRDRWQQQLSRYVSADTVYALLIDPRTVVVLRPDGTEVKVVALEGATASNITGSLAFLSYENSVSEKALTDFREGLSPARYVDVTTAEGRDRFHAALRLSARELIYYSARRLDSLHADYEAYEQAVKQVNEKVQGAPHDQGYQTALERIREDHRESIELIENVLPTFKDRIGRALPAKEEEARRFLDEAYTAEGASLVLARILFIRFFEDHEMVKRKISNGGVRAFREYMSHVQDDYRVLFSFASKDSEVVYRRFFEPSLFDFAHGGDGGLSSILLRVFYRLNAFDFTKVTGDVLGNLYERFLDPDKRKRIGEYYTPMPVAKYVLERLGFLDKPGQLLDPACGSGTFLIAALTVLVQDMRRRGVAPDVAVKQAIDLVHGLDINVFATFIAQMQLVWHLFPYLKEAKLKEIPELQVYGGDNSLVYDQPQTLTESVLLKPSSDSRAVRGGHYRYVVGNPPYIRNERLKDKGPWRDLYQEVDFRNSDISFFFVARSLLGGLLSQETAKARGITPVRRQSWLEDGGRMCFVLPMGLCDSDAASALRRELLTNCKIIEVTDLEEVAVHLFPSPQAAGRATTVPVLLFVEKAKAPEGHNVRVVRVSEKAFTPSEFISSELEASHVSQSLFLEDPVNPFGQILTKLREEDLPVLRKVMPQAHHTLGEFVLEPTPTYGIKIGGAGRLSRRPEAGLLPLAKGLNVSTFYVDPRIDRWVDLSQVESRSIWRRADLMRGVAYAVSDIALAPQAAAFTPSTLAFNNSAVVFVPTPEHEAFPWDVLINSSVTRFVDLLCLRTTLVPHQFYARSHHYPRVVASYPVPDGLLEDPSELVGLDRDLRQFAERIVRRSQAVVQAIASASKKALSLFNLDFGRWQGDVEEGAEIRLEQQNGGWVLRPYVEKQTTFMQLEGPYELLNVVKHIVEAGGGVITARELQGLEVPEDVKSISTLIDDARNPESPDIKQFKQLHSKADGIIAQTFGLTEEELYHIHRRLSTPPFDILQPRWPWTPVERRGIREYETDRFA